VTDKIRLLSKLCYEYARMSVAHNPYGDGLACSRIYNFEEGVRTSIFKKSSVVSLMLVCQRLQCWPLAVWT